MDVELQDQPERRVSERYNLSVAITVREPQSRQREALLQSISSGGCKISGGPIGHRGSLVWVRLPGLESQLAKVTRTAASEAAAAFVHPLHSAVAAHFAATCVRDSRMSAWSEVALAK